MGKTLRVLIVEDSGDDALLVMKELERGGYALAVERVETAEAMNTALASQTWDLVLADYSLPHFSAPDALEVLQESGLDLPFIVISGSIGEDVAVECMKAGAHDFFSKSRLTRLVAAAERELREAEVRRAHRRGDDALRESEEKYRSLYESSKDGITFSDMAGNLLDANEAFLDVVGYKIEEIRQLSYQELTAEKWHQMEADILTNQVIARGYCDEYEKEYVKKDGTVFPVTIRVWLIKDEQGKPAGMWAIVRDITERKTLERQLRQAAKMEAIGQLAGGVAHDFNNLLTGIIGFTQLAIDQLPDDVPVAEDLKEVRRLADSAANLTRQLLAFGRRQLIKPTVLNMNEVLESVVNMLQRLIGENIGLKFVRAAELGNTRADLSQVEQVLMNLAVNARDAMPDGGKLTIETGNVVLDQEYANRHVGVAPGPYVMLAVTDTGCGMDKETQARIFDPFFTTKEAGQGTGLGLSTVYGIVKQHGGNIWVYSEPDRGTTFKVYLPRVEAEAEAPTADMPAEGPTGGTETILLVEDEEAVLDIARRSLEAEGYTVLTASSPAEAEQLFEQHFRDIALLLSDVVLPQRSGRDLYEDLSAKNPALKVLYVSGYTDNAIVRNGVLEPGTPFLQKPFTPDALAWKVRKVLDS